MNTKEMSIRFGIHMARYDGVNLSTACNPEAPVAWVVTTNWTHVTCKECLNEKRKLTKNH